jgi:alkyl hydroperoxide reductase subunit AhpC
VQLQFVIVISLSPLPQDFTFVCPTEIVEFDKRYAEFKVRV